MTLPRSHPPSVRARRLGWALVLALALTLSLTIAPARADGPADPPAGSAAASPEPAVPVPVHLTLDVRDQPPRSATLTCVGRMARATGYLEGRALQACAEARRLARLLLNQPDPQRICTQIYGGPQTARVSGSIGGEPVLRRFSRRNGCEIADWNRAAGLLDADALPHPADVLVDYRRAGGIAGFDDRLTVLENGRATISRRGDASSPLQVPKEDLEALETALEDADFPSLDSEYLPKHPVADGFHYTLTHEGKTVRTADGAVPPALEPVVQALDRILAARPLGVPPCFAPGVDPRLVLCLPKPRPCAAQQTNANWPCPLPLPQPCPPPGVDPAVVRCAAPRPCPPPGVDPAVVLCPAPSVHVRDPERVSP